MDILLPGDAKAGIEALGKVLESKDQIADLRAQVNRLQMICEGMWTIIKSQTGATEEDLISLIAQIDLRDGKLDGKAATVPQTCSTCGRVVSNRTSICLYCRTQNVKTTVF
jgi:hypothetical protein